MDLHRWLLSAAAIAAMAAAPLEAQALHHGPTPIDLAIHPMSAAVGGTISLSGVTGHDGRRRTVTLVVLSPAGTAARLAATADAAGHFAVTFRQTQTPGTYRVQAASPDRTGHATAAFTIFTAAGIVESNVTAIDAVAADVASAVHAIQRALASIPMSPQRRALETRLADLDAGLAATPQQAAALAGVWGRLQQVTRRYPVLAPVFARTVRAMTEWNQRADQERPRLRVALQRIPATRACDLADRSAQAARWMTRAVDLISVPMELLRDIGRPDLVESRVADTLRLMPPRERDDARRRLAEAAAPSPTAPAVPWDLARVRLAAASAETAGVRLGDSICERFEGPISAILHAEQVRDGRPVWQYDLVVEGHLHLRYAKASAAGEPVAVTGHVNGHATRATLSDMFLAINLRPGTDVLWHADRPPDIGTASFRIPVAGELRGRTITLRLEPASRDWHLAGHVSYILITPGAFVPETLTADVPFQSASWLLSQAMGPDPLLAVSAEPGRRMTSLTGAYGRSFTAGDGRFTARVSVRACRPACPK